MFMSRKKGRVKWRKNLNHQIKKSKGFLAQEEITGKRRDGKLKVKESKWPKMAKGTKHFLSAFITSKRERDESTVKTGFLKVHQSELDSKIKVWNKKSQTWTERKEKEREREKNHSQSNQEVQFFCMPNNLLSYLQSLYDIYVNGFSNFHGFLF